MNNPKVNIIMNCYNGEKYLKEAIESVFSQTYKNWELIFWDNCSSDNSARIINSYNDDRIIYQKSKKHTSQYEARHQAVLHCKREFIAFLDVDDWWDKHKLEKQLKLFDNINVGFTSTNYWLIRQNKNKKKAKVFKKIPNGFILSKLLIQNFIGMSSLIFRKKTYLELEYGFNSKYEIVGDYDLVLRMSLNNEFASIQEPLSYYRWHEQNLSHKIQKNANELKLMVKDMKKNKSFYLNENFEFFADFSIYLSSLGYKLNNNLGEAINEAKKINNFFLKLRIFSIIILPLKIIKILRPS